MPTAAGLAYREAGPPDGPVALLLHGYPESSYMWRDLLPVLADAGWRAVAPDLAGLGDSPADLPATWERPADSVERLRAELGVERCVPVMHDWGGLIGLRWACEQPQAVEALVISASGFFPDGRWHGFAQAMRTPGQGEEFVAGARGPLGVRRSTSTGRPSATTTVARPSSASTARCTSRRSRRTRAGWRRSRCPSCSSSASRTPSSRRRRRTASSAS